MNIATVFVLMTAISLIAFILLGDCNAAASCAVPARAAASVTEAALAAAILAPLFGLLYSLSVKTGQASS